MGKSQQNIKDAVDAGYWHLYRFNPELDRAESVYYDSKEPTTSFKDYIMDQVRYSSLTEGIP